MKCVLDMAAADILGSVAVYPLLHAHIGHVERLFALVIDQGEVGDAGSTHVLRVVRLRVTGQPRLMF